MERFIQKIASPNTLSNMVSLMTDQVGLVHQMPFVCDRLGFAAQVEKIHFGASIARVGLVMNFFGVNCVCGMSCLIRKCVLDKAGGLKMLGNYIAEDYFLGRTFQKRYIDDQNIN